MKLALRGAFVLVVAGIAAQGGTAAPARMHTVPYSAFFWTPQDGLLGVGLCVSTKYMCGSGAVELTTDGGRTYRVILRTARPVFELRAIGRDGAFARVYSDKTYSYSRLVYRTLDRGRHWAKLRMRPGVSFATPRVGLGSDFSYDAGKSAGLRLLHTGDGGRSWQRLPKRADCGSEFPILDLVTPQLGWMVCGGLPGAGNEEKEVFRTRDGGHSWQARAWAIAGKHPETRGGLGFYGEAGGISFARDGFGLMWGGRGPLWVTRDGGKNWKPHSHFAEDQVDFGLGGSAFGNGTGFVLYQHLHLHGGMSWRLIVTHDFGRSWHIARSWRR